MGLRTRDAWHGRQRGSACGEIEELTSVGKFHFEPPSRFTSLDYLVGQRQRLVGDCEVERLSGLEVDHELELCRQHNRQITRLLAFEDASGINTDLTICIDTAGAVAHQAAGSDPLARVIDRGNSMSGRQRDNPLPLGHQEHAHPYVQRASPTLDERSKGALDLAAAADVEDFDLLPHGRSRSPDL
jgi:hypothetical protein